jgi:hypothetical protein
LPAESDAEADPGFEAGILRLACVEGERTDDPIEVSTRCHGDLEPTESRPVE